MDGFEKGIEVTTNVLGFLGGIAIVLGIIAGAILLLLGITQFLFDGLPRIFEYFRERRENR